MIASVDDGRLWQVELDRGKRIVNQPLRCLFPLPSRHDGLHTDFSDAMEGQSGWDPIPDPIPQPKTGRKVSRKTAESRRQHKAESALPPTVGGGAASGSGDTRRTNGHTVGGRRRDGDGMGATQLCRWLRRHGVDYSGCLEKPELVRASSQPHRAAPRLTATALRIFPPVVALAVAIAVAVAVAVAVVVVVVVVVAITVAVVVIVVIAVAVAVAIAATAATPASASAGGTVRGAQSDEAAATRRRRRSRRRIRQRAHSFG